MRFALVALLAAAALAAAPAASAVPSVCYEPEAKVSTNCSDFFDAFEPPVDPIGVIALLCEWLPCDPRDHVEELRDFVGAFRCSPTRPPTSPCEFG